MDPDVARQLALVFDLTPATGETAHKLSGHVADSERGHNERGGCLLLVLHEVSGELVGGGEVLVAVAPSAMSADVNGLAVVAKGSGGGKGLATVGARHARSGG